MQVIDTPSGMQTLAQQLNRQGKTIALIPTMGNLHAGHLSLIEAVKPLADMIVVSIFVNPTQFGPNEDLANYPRTFEQDCDHLKSSGVDIVFAPKTTDMYPANLDTQTYIKVPQISEGLCAISRPTHFQGVATIVCKLFQLVLPTMAIFGEKDFQQLQVIRRMVTDLSIPVQILSAPIIRETNGLAMSSRNLYLNEEQREQAAELYRSLQNIVKQAQTNSNYMQITQQAIEHLNASGFKTDYIEIRRQQDLQHPHPNDTQLVVLAAAFLGKTRLIDNIAFEVP